MYKPNEMAVATIAAALIQARGAPSGSVPILIEEAREGLLAAAKQQEVKASAEAVAVKGVMVRR
jgi:phenylpyruvate tautomerase PptA (4-oxalocrotonate tautomerase family)